MHTRTLSKIAERHSPLDTQFADPHSHANDQRIVCPSSTRHTPPRPRIHRAFRRILTSASERPDAQYPNREPEPQGRQDARSHSCRKSQLNNECTIDRLHQFSPPIMAGKLALLHVLFHGERLLCSCTKLIRPFQIILRISVEDFERLFGLSISECHHRLG